MVIGSFAPLMLVVATLFSARSAGLTVVLKIKFPLLDWKVESDLWHHPRKYVVPGIMLLVALPVSIFMGGF